MLEFRDFEYRIFQCQNFRFGFLKSDFHHFGTKSLSDFYESRDFIKSEFLKIQENSGSICKVIEHKIYLKKAQTKPFKNSLKTIKNTKTSPK